MSDTSPTPEGLARDLLADLALCDLVVSDDRGALWEIATAAVRRALSAEARVKELEAEVRRLWAYLSEQTGYSVEECQQALSEEMP